MPIAWKDLCAEVGPFKLTIHKTDSFVGGIRWDWEVSCQGIGVAARYNCESESEAKIAVEAYLLRARSAIDAAVGDPTQPVRGPFDRPVEDAMHVAAARPPSTEPNIAKNYKAVKVRAGDRFRSAEPFRITAGVIHIAGAPGPVPGKHLEGTVEAVGFDFVRFDASTLEGYMLAPGQQPEFWAEQGRMCGSIVPKA